MTVQTWSNEQILDDFNDCSSLNDVLRAVEERMWSKGEVLCEIYVNGLAFREEDEEKFANSNLSEIEELKIKSNSPKDLVYQTLNSIGEFLPDVLLQVDESSKEFRVVESQKAYPYFSELLESCRWLTDAIYLIRVQLQNWPEVGKIVEEWKNLEDKHSQAMRQLLEAFELRDEVLIADILEYDLADVLEDWRRFTPRVLDAMKDAKLPACPQF